MNEPNDSQSQEAALKARYGELAYAAGVEEDLEKIRSLLEAGADPRDHGALRLTIERGQTQCLSLLLDRGADPNDRQIGGAPLHAMLDWAYRRPIMECLLKHGADPNRGVGPFEETALHVAVRRRRLPAVEVLIEAGADINARNKYGKTAWSHARRRGFPEIAARELLDGMTMLLDAGLDIASRGLDGGTALHQAAWFGAPRSAELLIRRQAPIDLAGDDHHGSPLVWVAHGSKYSGDADARVADYVKITEMLCEAGASFADPERLLSDAVPAVAAVLKRYGARGE